MEVSEEQQVVIDEVKRGSNVVVDAVAGSGKTTTILAMAAQMPDVQFLQIAFNTQLRVEVKERADAMGLTNIDIHTFHSVCSAHFGCVTRNDDELEDAIDEGLCHELSCYGVVVLDEAQDIRPLLHRFAMIFTPYDAQLVIVGDRYQCIYEYMGADRRYLTAANEMWGGREFVSMTLNVSHRIPPKIADFINKAVLSEERIVSRSDRPGCARYAYYDFASLYNANDLIMGAADIILKAIKNVGIDEVFVLAPTIRGQTGKILKAVENIIVGADRRNYCYYAVSDEEVANALTLRNKLVFSTYHQAKGRERKIVIVLQFDRDYIDLYARDSNGLQCPDAMYVALTRARNNVVLIGSNQKAALPFVNVKQMAELGKSWSDATSRIPAQSLPYVRRLFKGAARMIAVSDIIRGLNPTVRRSMRRCIKPCFELLNEPIDDKLSKIVTMINFGSTHENVSHHIGTALPTAMIHRLGGHDKKKLETYFKEAVKAYSKDSRLKSPLNQITHYNWMPSGEAILNRACTTLKERVCADDLPKREEVEIDNVELGISARVDAVSVDGLSVWEFKTSSSGLTFDAFLQVMFYALCAGEDYKQYYLFNIVTCELHRFVYDAEVLAEFGAIYKASTSH